MKKIANLEDYLSAYDSAQLLSLKMGRPIRADYVSKMRHSRKHSIRTARIRDRLLYHKADIEACVIAQRQ